jgi:hypothetical protein
MQRRFFYGMDHMNESNVCAVAVPASIDTAQKQVYASPVLVEHGTVESVTEVVSSGGALE